MAEIRASWQGRLICTWCEKDMGLSPVLGGDSYGTCLECEQLIRELLLQKEENTSET